MTDILKTTTKNWVLTWERSSSLFHEIVFDTFWNTYIDSNCTFVIPYLSKYSYWCNGWNWHNFIILDFEGPHSLSICSLAQGRRLLAGRSGSWFPLGQQHASQHATTLQHLQQQDGDWRHCQTVPTSLPWQGKCQRGNCCHCYLDPVTMYTAIEIHTTGETLTSNQRAEHHFLPQLNHAISKSLRTQSFTNFPGGT